MKLTLGIIVTLLGVASCWGQGTVGTVVVENTSAQGGVLPIYMLDGITPLRGEQYKAYLFHNGAQVGDIYSFSADGRFSSRSSNLNPVPIPGTAPGGTAILQIRVWDSSTSAPGVPTYDTASLKATSPEFSNPLGSDTIPAPTLVNMPSFSLAEDTGAPRTIIPEPTTFALGLLGSLTFIGLEIRRRRLAS